MAGFQEQLGISDEQVSFKAKYGKCLCLQLNIQFSFALTITIMWVGYSDAVPPSNRSNLQRRPYTIVNFPTNALQKVGDP